MKRILFLFSLILMLGTFTKVEAQNLPEGRCLQVIEQNPQEDLEIDCTPWVIESVRGYDAIMSQVIENGRVLKLYSSASSVYMHMSERGEADTFVINVTLEGGERAHFLLEFVE